MKIAWLTPYPVSQLGDALKWGIHRTSGHPCSWIMNLSKALAEDTSTELHLLTFSPWVVRSQVVEKNGMFIHVIKSGIPFLYRGYPDWFRIDAKMSYFLESKKIRKELAVIKPDLVHAHGTENQYGLAAMRSGYPYLLSIQGIIAEFNKTDPSAYFDIMQPKEELVVKKSRYFTCRTHFDTSFVQRLNPHAKIFDIPEAMNPIFFKEQWSVPEEYRVLFIGGGLRRKGLHELIEAMGVVVKSIPEASVDVVGACSLAQQEILHKMANEYGVPIRFHGFMNAESIAQLHRQCRLFVLCSSNENSPNTLAEAMVSGMPVVSYNVGGVSSMFSDGDSGVLVKPHDVNSLAEKIYKLLDSRELSQRMGNKAAEFSRAHNHPDHVAKETMKAYEFILRNERVL